MTQEFILLRQVIMLSHRSKVLNDGWMNLKVSSFCLDDLSRSGYWNRQKWSFTSFQSFLNEGLYRNTFPLVMQLMFYPLDFSLQKLFFCLWKLLGVVLSVFYLKTKDQTVCNSSFRFYIQLLPLQNPAEGWDVRSKSLAFCLLHCLVTTVFFVQAKQQLSQW